MVSGRPRAVSGRPGPPRTANPSRRVRSNQKILAPPTHGRPSHLTTMTNPIDRDDDHDEDDDDDDDHDDDDDGDDDDDDDDA